MKPATASPKSRLWLILVALIVATCGGVEESGKTSAIAPPSTKSWALALGGSGSETIDALATDAAGNIVVGGTFSENLAFGDQAYTSKGAQDVYVAKLTAGGSPLWSLSLGSEKPDELSALAVDRDGAIYVAGAYLGALAIGAQTLTAAGGSDIFVAKLASGGEVLWAKSFGGDGLDGGARLAVEADGSILLAGQFSGTISFGSKKIVSSGSTDVFVAHLSADGAYLEATSPGGSGAEAARGVAALPERAQLLYGTFDGSMPQSKDGRKSQGEDDVFLLRCERGCTR